MLLGMVIQICEWPSPAVYMAPICTMRNQGQFQTLEKSQVLRWAPLKNSSSENLDLFSGWQLGKISGATLKITFHCADCADSHLHPKKTPLFISSCHTFFMERHVVTIQYKLNLINFIDLNNLHDQHKPAPWPIFYCTFLNFKCFVRIVELRHNVSVRLNVGLDICQQTHCAERTVRAVTFD